MATSRTVKKRIKATKNISQITKAMEAVSAVKMRKSEEVALLSRPYSLAALEILKNLSGRLSEADFHSPLLEKKESGKICLVVVTSDKGLCGAFNSNVLRRAVSFALEKKKTGEEIEIIAIGRKGADFLKRRGFSVRQEVTGVGDFGAIEETKFLANTMKELYESGEYREIFGAYTKFLSVMKQEPCVEKILPFTSESIEERIGEIVPIRGKYSGTPGVLGGSGAGVRDYVFEPTPAEVLRELLPLLLEIQVYYIILEANASEHSARMMAMKNASENAEELIETLTLEYNKARQAQITRELTEITAGVAAQEQ